MVEHLSTAGVGFLLAQVPRTYSYPTNLPSLPKRPIIMISIIKLRISPTWTIARYLYLCNEIVYYDNAVANIILVKDGSTSALLHLKLIAANYLPVPS